ncbi:Acetylcholine receptor subunit beta-like 2 [Gryllus bimaculatus]|nr:Acetylcholine receptor subunit beta-like 2 [Gryllus bimaculatus]
MHRAALLVISCLYNALAVSALRPINAYEANPDAKRLYDDLLSNYNRLIRPVTNNSETLTVYLGLKLSQLIEVVSDDVISEIYHYTLYFSKKYVAFKMV